MKSVSRRTRGFVIAASGVIWVLFGLLVIGSPELATVGGFAIVLGLYYARSSSSTEQRRFGWKRPPS